MKQFFSQRHFRRPYPAWICAGTGGIVALASGIEGLIKLAVLAMFAALIWRICGQLPTLRQYAEFCVTLSWAALVMTVSAELVVLWHIILFSDVLPVWAAVVCLIVVSVLCIGLSAMGGVCLNDLFD
jgi:hypothetical protein